MRQDRNPNHISGIYNYCDRWCERCFFTSRCAVFEQTKAIPEVEDDMNNKAFWDRISQNFKDAEALLRAAAKEYGIDIDDIKKDEMREYEEREKEIRSQLKLHPLTGLTETYMRKADEFLQTNKNWIQETSRQLTHHVDMGIQSEKDAMNRLELAVECVEIVSWYLHFIYVKFQRALDGKLSTDDLAEEHGFPKDSDGSAKVALISVDRTIDAWIKFNEMISGYEDEILDILALLQKLRTIAEREFPEARHFKRPGFDDLN